MLFSRRAPPDWREAVRVSLWPRRSWMRSLRYARLRIRRLDVMPRSLALGMAAGVFVAVLPIPGVQMLAAAGLAWLIRGHRGVAALATFAANPITYPLIWLASYALGATILGTPVTDAAHDLDRVAGLMANEWSPAHTGSRSPLWPIMSTLAIGAVPLAIVSASVAYVGVRALLRRQPAAARLTRRPAVAVHLDVAKFRRRRSDHRRPVVKAAA